MGFDDLVDCFRFISSAIGQAGVSAGQASHAIGELSKAVGACSHAYGYSSSLSSLPCRQSTVKSIIMMSIVRKPLIKIDGIKNATLTVDNAKINWDVLEKNFGPFNKGDAIFYK